MLARTPKHLREPRRPGGFHPIDVHVGQRMRVRRTLLGMSQEKLGERIGLTFQQVQKYERGANRVSASRLWDLSQVLDVPISFFFDDLPAEIAVAAAEEAHDPDGRDPMAKRETLELARAYYRIRDDGVRKRVFELVKAIAAGDHAD